MTDSLYCANHPQTETMLRCNRCEKPICIKCAVLTDTGYRCKECVRGQQKVFDTAEWYDYIITFAIVSILSYLGSLVAARIGFFIIFLAPIAGVAIAEVTRIAIRRRRSKRLFQVAALAAVLGSLPMLLPVLLFIISGGGLGAILPLVWQAYYTFTVTSTVYYRMRGIRIG